MTGRTWQTQADEWKRLPVDDLGYYTAEGIMNMTDREIRSWAQKFERIRYSGWRNDGGLWRKYMGLDSVKGKQVLDYGSGCGIEALQYAKNGNLVHLADINRESLELAERVLRVFGYAAASVNLITDERPGEVQHIDTGSLDLVVMNGVLHHIENPVPAIHEAHRVLGPKGEFRVMVYTDRGWQLATGTEPPHDVTDHPRREQFVRWGDEVGDWADWYDADRLQARVRPWFTVRSWHYIGHAADPHAPEELRGRYGIGIMDRQ